jgi:hypothetical protein
MTQPGRRPGAGERIHAPPERLAGGIGRVTQFIQNRFLRGDHCLASKKPTYQVNER